MKKNFKRGRTENGYSDYADAYDAGEAIGYTTGFSDAVFQARELYISQINEHLSKIKKMEYISFLIFFIFGILSCLVSHHLLLIMIISGYVCSHNISKSIALKEVVEMIEFVKIEEAE